MSNSEESGRSNGKKDNDSYDKARAAVKESLMDFVGHFSTASAILAGFYIAVCVFIISIKAEESKSFAFLDEPLLAEITELGDLAQEILAIFYLEDFWPTHFQYMILIFIFLFLLSLISYACFIRASMIQMQVLRKDRTISEEIVLLWLQRGMNSLFFSLILSFLAIPWAILRFLTTQALTLAFLLLVIVVISLSVAFKGIDIVYKVFSRIHAKFK